MTNATIVHVSAAGSDDPKRAGSDKDPVATLARALQLVAPRGTIRLAAGTYHGPVKVAQPVTLHGGYDAKFTKVVAIAGDALLARATAAAATSTIIAGANGAPALEIAAAVTLANLVVHTGNATSGSAISMLVRPGAGLDLDGVQIVAGDGGPGARGTDAGRAPHPEARGGTGGNGGQGEKGRFARPGSPRDEIWCTSHPGTAGESRPGATGGAGGQPGASKIDQGSWTGAWGGAGGDVAIEETRRHRDPPDTEAGHDGVSGQPGIAGTLGALAPQDPGVLVGEHYHWVGTPGGDGSSGSGGAGGGGGGAGGSRDLRGRYFCSDAVELGGRGGKGGDGTTGGRGGLGGGTGGASIGIVIDGARITAKRTCIFLGRGGNGGDGGAAEQPIGGPSEAGLNGPYDVCGVGITFSGSGGNGGYGGQGGAGGGGAGGHGGPAIGVALVGTASLAGDPISTRGGRGGRGGTGGSGVAPSLPGQVLTRQTLARG